MTSTDTRMDADQCQKTLVFIQTPEGRANAELIFNLTKGYVTLCDSLESAKELLTTGEYTAIISDLTEHDPKGMELVEWANATCPNIRSYLMAKPCQFDIKAQFWEFTDNGIFLHMGSGEDEFTRTLNAMFHDFSPVSWIGVVENELNRIRMEVMNEKGAVVLIKGAPGTAKSTLAQIAHFRSARKYRNFVFVECANKRTLPHNSVFSDELTDKLVNTIKAIMRQADGGTVYFHHIDRLPREVQYMLQRQFHIKPTLHEKPATYPHVVACSLSSEPETLLEEKLLVREMYEEISVHTLRIPSITEYRQNISTLANDLMNRYCQIQHLKPRGFTKGALEALTNHGWVRNIREFFGVIKNVAQVGKSSKRVVHEKDLFFNRPEILKVDSQPERRRKVMEQLRTFRGNKTDVAAFFGVARKTLYEWMQKYNIPIDYK